MGTKRLEHHVIHLPTGKWTVKRGGTDRPIIETDKRYEAMRFVTAFSIRTGSKVIIHG
jgi:hypothetical protein